MHSFDALALLRSVPYETSIPSYCNIFITHTNIHLKIFVDEILCGSLIFVVFLKTDLTIIDKFLLHFSLFQRFLLLQTVVSNLHLHLKVLCHSMCLVSLLLEIKYFDIYVFNNIRNT